MRKDLQDLWLLAEPYVRDAGFDLIEVQFGREQRGSVLRLFIDRPVPDRLDRPVPDRLDRPQTTTGSTGGAVGESEAAGAEGTNPTLITVDDCERVSRDVSAALDVADKIPNAYQLEVSSPGLDRPLRRERDFARFVGESAKVRLEVGVEGRRNFSGTIRGAKDGRVEIACDGRSYELPIDDIVRANLVPDWDREFHRSAS
ncbi:MAG TPA: ribosome maturation factor RimP [Polyangia bacterium]|nr:ribosome maturation factor RimP [Polyangia bacterium]